MSRTLTRPMFRLGGSTSGGITSGLDTPKLKASRQGYDDGDLVEQRFKKYRGLYDKYAPRSPGMMPGSVSSFLTNFGLNLLSQTPTGNIFSTAGTAAKGPFQQFQGARSQELESQRRLNQSILGDVIETVSEEEQERLGASGTGNIGQEAKLNRELSRLYGEMRTLKKEEADLLQKQKDGTLTPEETERLGELTGEYGTISSVQSQIDESEGNISIFEQIKGVLGPDWLGMRVNEYESAQHPTADPPRKYTRAEAEAKAIEDAKDLLKRLEKKAEGGRIEKQLGGEVDFQENVEVERPVGGRTQSTSLYNLDYTTLRSRLPQEIGDDIVKLLAESEEALTEFANIRTQEDVNQFNTQFSVNLVLPQEV